jgi:hypothetical protein
MVVILCCWWSVMMRGTGTSPHSVLARPQSAIGGPLGVWSVIATG